MNGILNLWACKTTHSSRPTTYTSIWGLGNAANQVVMMPRDYTEGPPDTTKIANSLLNDNRIGQFELIHNGKGLKTVFDRPGFVESDYNFSAEILEEMIHELDCLIVTKYGGPEWNTNETANHIVELLVEHSALIQTKLNEVNSGARKLTEKDFLGPTECECRRDWKLQVDKDVGSDAMHARKDNSKYFLSMENKILKEKRQMMR
ncbi:hypothetical protein ACHAWF_014488 [Thalassiosira exigua]